MTSASVFVIGHEYGHVTAGHLTGDTTTRAFAARQAQVVNVRSDQELEADRLGVTLTITAQQSRGYDIATSFAGADVALTAIEIGERALAVARTGNVQDREIPDSHPPPLARRAAARQFLSRLPISDVQRQSALELATGLETTAEIMWAVIEPILIQVHAAGERPAAIWKP
jgi:Zn-dependent protease with chaperone function